MAYICNWESSFVIIVAPGSFFLFFSPSTATVHEPWSSPLMNFFKYVRTMKISEPGLKTSLMLKKTESRKEKKKHNCAKVSYNNKKPE